MTANSLRALDGVVSLVTDQENGYEEIVSFATSLLSSALPQQVQEQAKILLASLHPNKSAYNNHKVCELFAKMCCCQHLLYTLNHFCKSFLSKKVYLQNKGKRSFHQHLQL